MRKQLGFTQVRWKRYAFGVALLHVAGILLLLLSLPQHSEMLGLGVLAYMLGLRHAFDADHIAAIDNTVRKLVQQNKHASGVGFYFSLGHSSVVCCMAVVTAFAAKWAADHLPGMEALGGLIGASVSGGFLVLIGILNLIVFIGIIRLFRNMRRNKHDDGKLEQLLQSRGLIARAINPLFKFVNKSWHIYPIGFLFGLGFDTASEIALLAISAGAAQSAIPMTGILALPLLFAAGMSLLDTADGVFMTNAYRWAFNSPLRKIYYNMCVTGLSVVAALLIGVVELVQIITPKLGLAGGFWDWLQNLDFGILGYILAASFVVCWAVSFGLWKYMRIEERWANTN